MRLLAFTLLLFTGQTFGQASFTKVTDTTNALAVLGPVPVYNGVSWVDYNADGQEDCFVSSNNLYRNEGNGSFTKVDFSPINFGLGNGNSWADYDGDGDLDVMIAASPARLYQNQGGSFTSVPLLETPMDTFNFWSAAWGDYNGDGWVDLALMHPAGFLPPSIPVPQPSLLLKNQQNGTFSIVESPIDDELAAHTVGSWTDYDHDGDLDLFIGSGEVYFLSRDHLYVNQLQETGTADLTRLQEGALAEDMRDGQNWNFIDYDLDGDLDAFITNYNDSKANDLYQNEQGVYLRQTVDDVGPIAGQNGAGLNNVWCDFDNDGFQDCLVVFDGQEDRFYHNNSDGSFTEVDQAFSIPGKTRGAAAADYDNDGYLDLMISGAAEGLGGLYHNDGGQNRWVQIRLEGNSPNTAAIGAKVRLRSKINGELRWQYRELNAQNTFNGHNSYRIHFGLGPQAEIIDSVVVEWPDGSVQGLPHLKINQSCTWRQNGDTNCAIVLNTREAKQQLSLKLTVQPNPVSGMPLVVKFQQAAGDSIYWQLYSAKGEPLSRFRGRTEAQMSGPNGPWSYPICPPVYIGWPPGGSQGKKRGSGSL